MIAVMTMQLATTLKEVTPALATVDTQAMDSHALVSKFFQRFQMYLDKPAFPVHLSRY